MSQHLGQKIFTVAVRNTSEVPTGKHGWLLQNTFGHRLRS